MFYNNRIYVAIGQDPAHGRGRGMLTCIDATKTGDITQTGKVWTFDEDPAQPLDRLDRRRTALHRRHRRHDPLPRRRHGPTLLDPRDEAKKSGAPRWWPTARSTSAPSKSFWVLAAGKEKKVLNTIRLGSPVWCTPIAANGVLYVASQKYLWAVEAAKGP